MSAKRVAILLVAAATAALLTGLSRWNQDRTISKAQAWLEKELGPLGRTIDEILSHEGSRPNHTIAGAIAYRIGQKIDTSGERSLTEAERRFGAVYWLQAEVNNGGFHQYFLNSAGNYAGAALAGLNAMGASKTATLLERAMAVFPGSNPPADRRRRLETMSRISTRSEPVWEQISSEFYKLTEPLGDLLVVYAKKNRAGFAFP